MSDKLISALLAIFVICESLWCGARKISRYLEQRLSWPPLVLVTAIATCSLSFDHSVEKSQSASLYTMVGFASLIVSAFLVSGLFVPFVHVHDKSEEHYEPWDS